MLRGLFEKYCEFLLIAPIKTGGVTGFTLLSGFWMANRIIKGQMALRKLRNTMYPVKSVPNRPRRTFRNWLTGLNCVHEVHDRKPNRFIMLADRGIHFPTNGDVAFCAVCLKCFIAFNRKWVPENKLSKKMKQAEKKKKADAKHGEKLNNLALALREEYGIQDEVKS